MVSGVSKGSRIRSEVSQEKSNKFESVSREVEFTLVQLGSQQEMAMGEGVGYTSTCQRGCRIHFECILKCHRTDRVHFGIPVGGRKHLEFKNDLGYILGKCV